MRLCALRLDSVIETMRVLPIQAVEADSAPDCLVGLALIRGQPCPVLDLARLLGDQQEPGRLILLRVSGGVERRVALAVTSVEGVSRIRTSVLSEMPPLLSAANVDLVEAIGVHDAQLMTILKAGSLLSETDWAALEAV